MIEIFKSGVYFGIHVNSGYFWWSFKWNQLLLLLPTIKSTLASTFVLWLGYSAAFVIASLSRASSFLPEHSNLIHSLFIISIHFWPLRLWLGPWWCGTWSWWFFRCLKLYSSISVFIRVLSHHRRLKWAQWLNPLPWSPAFLLTQEDLSILFRAVYHGLLL